VRVRILKLPESVARAVAASIVRAVSINPRLVLGLPTGRTPVPLYAELVRQFRKGRVDFSGVRTFNLDEFVGIAPGDPRSYRSFMQRHLFDHVNVNPRHIHFLNGVASDIDRECRRYERAVRQTGPIDLMILGLGTNGHIGFNEPADAVEAITHRARLTSATRRANAALFDNAVRSVPREGLSLGIATILQSRRIFLIATGRSKARCVERLRKGPITPRLPASFLQLHGGVEVWLDQAASLSRS
jgi:glucosamine-6-phosphate deaminase